MRERLITLMEVAAAMAITAIMLGSLFYLAGRARDAVREPGDVLSVETPEAPVAKTTLTVAPVPEVPPTPSVTYLSLDELRARCVKEVRQSNPPTGADSFCALYARVTKRQEVATVPALPPTPAPALVPAEPLASDTPEKSYTVWVNDCRPYGYGSIAYRKCRAHESKRLSRECSERRSLLNLVGYSASDDERGWARAWCREADRYQIVN